MAKIPHGHTPEKRRKYAELLKEVATSYYENGRWKNKRNDTNVVLVEVWEKGGKVSIHPSRNRCFPVETSHRSTWHALATDPNKMLTFQSGAHARARRGRAPAPIAHSKPLAIPAWAREADLIGYTSAQPIRFNGNRIPIANLRSYPSVYYKNGHATLDHMKPGNIGWEYGTDWKCLFFGNVPTRFV